MTQLVKNSELKSEYWRTMQQSKKDANHIYYDKELDTLVLSVDCPQERIITHYIDSCVALLYRYSDKELIGIRIESFSKRFTSHLKEYGTWKLSENDVHIDGIDDMLFSLKIQNISKPEETIHLKHGIDLIPEFARTY